MGEWRPIETAQKDAIEGVLGYHPAVGIRTIWWDEARRAWVTSLCEMNATHWMPLPEPPK